MPDPKQITDPVDAETMLSGDAVLQDGLPVVAAYVRSARANATGANSLSAQEQTILSACERYFPDGCHVIVYKDCGPGVQRSASGQTPATLRQIVNLAAAGRIHYVCCVSPDRLTRDADEYLRFACALGQTGAKLLFVGGDGSLIFADDDALYSSAAVGLLFPCHRVRRVAVYHRLPRSGSAE